MNANKNNTISNLKNQLGLRTDRKWQVDQTVCSPKTPKLLLNNHAFTSLVINSYHKKFMHAGLSHTSSAIRTHSRFPSMDISPNCRRRRRHQGGPYRMPHMAPYPPSSSPRLSRILICERERWIRDTKGAVDLPLYLFSSQSHTLGTHQRHVCRAIPLVPKKMYRQAWQAETDNIWYCSTIQASTVYSWLNMVICYH